MIHNMITISPISAFQDNYIWLLSDQTHAVVVDPGDAEPVIQALEQQNLQLRGILVTHHHNDHIGGIPALINRYQPLIYAPEKETYAFPHTTVKQGDHIKLPLGNIKLGVIEVPGHTLGHIAYYGANSLFCGDTLFGAGCGRLFEGTAAQMYASLQKLASLPAPTKVYCAHEYTEHNLRFAQTLAPDDPKIATRLEETRDLIAAGRPSLPSTIAQELATNPFLRCDDPIFIAATRTESSEPVAVFGALRELRNHF
jgi:hydroxyacylglutathione hydrolase